MLYFLLSLLMAVAVSAAKAALDEAQLLQGLRSRDEAAFAGLVRTYHGSLVRLARQYVASDAAAEEVAQDTWMALLNGIDRFEERSSLKTWLFRVLINRAKSRGVRDQRVTAHVDIDAMADAASVSADQFDGRGMWRSPPAAWGNPEQLLGDHQLVALIQAELVQLPPQQCRVVTLRDVEGLDAAEVCELLQISEENQRVLLHRGRARLRQAIARHLTEGASC